MKLIFSLIVFISQISQAHEAHDSEMKAKSPLPGASILQLESEWKNQKGESIKLSQLRGTSRIVVMLFTKCDTACPLIVEDIKSIANDVDAKRLNNVKVTLFSLDSFRETPATLMAFSFKRKLPLHWELLTSNADAVAELAAALGIRYKRLPNGDYIHSNIIYFIDANGVILTQKEGIKTPRDAFVKKIKLNL